MSALVGHLRLALLICFCVVVSPRFAPSYAKDSSQSTSPQRGDQGERKRDQQKSSNTSKAKKPKTHKASKGKTKRRAKKPKGKTKRRAKKPKGKTKRRAKKPKGKTKRRAKKPKGKAKRRAQKPKGKAKRRAQKPKGKAKRRAKKSKRRRYKRQYYTVTRGETWTTVAKTLKVKLKSLKRWNRKLRRRKRLKPGLRLAFYGAERRAESIGKPNRGALKYGVRLDPDGDGLGRGFAVARHRAALWGTPELVKLVKKCGRTYRRYFSRKYAPIPVGDLSSRDGGPLKSHKSHQSGRDVDVGFMRKKPLSKGYFSDTSPRQMNMYAQWVVLKCFLDDPQTQMIFIERSRVRALKKYIKRIYKKRPKKLKRYLGFFPGGRNKVIRPDKVHKSHMHVRIRCPKGDRRCSH